MTPLSFLRTLALAVVGTVCLPLVTSRAADHPPHAVFIIPDDHHWRHCGIMGHPHIRTPHLGRLTADPDEAANLALSRPDEVRALNARLDAWWKP